VFPKGYPLRTMTRKRIWSLITFAVLVGVLLGASLYLRNFLLRQVEKRIRSVVQYSSIRLRIFPPSLVFRDIRTVSAPGIFSAEEVLIQLPLASLLKSEKPLTIVITRPVIRITQGPPSGGKKKKSGSLPALPFSLARAVVRDGEVDYFGRSVGFTIRGLRAVVEPQGISYILTAEAEAASVWMDASRVPLEGRLGLTIDAGPQGIQVKRFSLAGPEGRIRAAGSLSGAPDFAGSLDISYNTEMAMVARVLKIPLNWGGRLEGRGVLTRDRGALSFRTDFSSDDLELNRTPLEKARGHVDVLPGQGVVVNMDLLRITGVESIRIRYADGEAKGNLQGFHLDPVFSYVKLPYPVRSPIWGDFSINGRGLTADIEFRDENLSRSPSGKYGLRGPCHFNWDMHSAIAFQLPELEMAFGRMGVNGEVIIDRSVDVSIKGEVSDVRGGRAFTETVLGHSFSLPDIRGGGQASIRIFGAISGPDVSFDFSLAPAGFDKFDLSAAEGTVLISRGVVTGRFTLADPELKGGVELTSGPAGLDATIRLSEGELTRILPGLSLDYPFSGRVAGEFQVSTRGKSLRVEGNFAAPLMMFETEGFHSVSGRLTWDGETIAFPELACDYYGGKVAGSWQLDTHSEVMDIDLTAKEIDLHQLTSSLSGKMSFDVKGRGRLGEKNGAGRFVIKEILVDPFQPADAEGGLELRLSTDKVAIAVKGVFSPGDNDFSVNAEVPFSKDGFAVDVKGGFSNLDILLPWKGARGRLNYTVEVRGTPTVPQVSGAIDIQGTLLPFPQFSQALTDYTGLVIVKSNRATIRSFRGKLGGGEIQGGGEVVVGKGGPEIIDVTFQGKNLQLSPFERTLA
ncbi:MAG: hypothetical protein LUO89_13815, partial [Methanothrix sp.]|nr:hypothetical protein [Methanothrix sp.]